MAYQHKMDLRSHTWAYEREPLKKWFILTDELESVSWLLSLILMKTSALFQILQLGIKLQFFKAKYVLILPI